MEILQNATYDDFMNWTNMSIPLADFDNNSMFLSDSQVRDSPIVSSSSLHLQEPSLLSVVSLTILLGVLILSTVVGNLFVLTAILRERNLQTVSNYLVFSLAIADLMVACLVMPMGAQYEVMNQQWVLGATLCELWTSADVLCCTASILHLVAIAVDRFRAVTSIDYVQHRNTSRVGLTIALVWGVAFLVSFAPILGWKDDKFLYRIQEEKRCLLSQDIGYQIFATCSTFYMPLVLILILYWRIYKVARRRIRRRPIRPATLLPLVSEGITSFNGSVKSVSVIVFFNTLLTDHELTRVFMAHPPGHPPAPRLRRNHLFQRIRQVGHPIKVEEASQRYSRVQTREKSWKNPGHHHRCFRHLLAAILRNGSSHGPLHLLRTPSPALLTVPVARIPQLYPQSTYLHPFQPGLQEGVCEGDMGKEASVDENLNVVVEGFPSASD
ncbi:unnamed protein product [Larinioides sclopetarius]|uniref:G-protein coupled receptors family 1 profile domain-containing protein n=1 Tax=Larinioides sclopetarius TaxID=280406 RepID=A0AAV2A5Q7_9ARAC